jgi:hypothetical protein
MNRALFTAAILVCTATPVCAGFSAVEFSGTWEQELSIASNEGDAQKFEALIEPEWNFAFDNGLELTAIGRLRLDLIGDLGPAKSRPDNYSGINGPWAQSAHGEVSLREFYLDAEWFGAYWRMGKQQVVWGQADELKVLDVVNPQSFREFNLDDFDDSRIPLWMLNVEVPIAKDDTLQFLWIPDTTYHELAEPGTPYQITSPRLIPGAPAGVPVEVSSPVKPDRFPADSDIGLRYSSFRGGWDITLNYLYHYADLPVLYQDLDAGGVTIHPEYERSHLFGGTLSNAFGDFTLRAEVGYSTDTFHVTNQVLDRGISNSPELASVLGLDWQGLSDTFVSVQWFQSHLFDYDRNTVRDRTEHTLSLLVQRYFASETWKLELLVLQSLNEHDGLLRPKLTHTMLSNLDIWLSADIFHGNEDGLFGQFDQADRVSLGFRLGF